VLVTTPSFTQGWARFLKALVNIPQKIREQNLDLCMYSKFDNELDKFLLADTTGTKPADLNKIFASLPAVWRKRADEISGSNRFEIIGMLNMIDETDLPAYLPPGVSGNHVFKVFLY
jgi:hypothetical protein